MPLRDAPLEGAAQLVGRRLDARTHERAQLVSVTLPVDHRLQDGPTAGAHDVGQHRGELEVGVLQRLLQPLHVAGLLAHELFAGGLAQPRRQLQQLGRRRSEAADLGPSRSISRKAHRRDDPVLVDIEPRTARVENIHGSLHLAPPTQGTPGTKI